METNHAQILETPVWVLIARIAQGLISLVIVAMAGVLMHGAYLDEHGLCIAIGLFTWIVVAYNILTEKISVLHKLYHVIAVMVLDGLMMILWLATFAATAARRSKFVVPVNVNQCYNNGSLVNSNYCIKRSLVTRDTILFKSGQGMMSANAGLGALVWLLFIATFVWTMVFFFKGRKEGRFLFATDSPSFQMENKTEAQPQAQQPVVQAQQHHPGGYEKNDFQAQQTAYDSPAAYPSPVQGQGQYPQQPYQPAVSPQPTGSPSPVATGAGGYPAQELYGQQQYQAGYYGQGSELSGTEVQHQPPSYPPNSPPPQQHHYPPNPPQ